MIYQGSNHRKSRFNHQQWGCNGTLLNPFQMRLGLKIAHTPKLSSVNSHYIDILGENDQLSMETTEPFFYARSRNNVWNSFWMWIRGTNYDQGYSGRWWKQGNDKKHGFVCIAPQRCATSRCPPCFHQCSHRVKQ